MAVAPASARAAPCAVAPDPAALPGAAELREMNAFVASLGARPTGSETHARYVDWIRRQLRRIPGVDLREIDYPITRWTPRSASLTLHDGARDVRLPIA